MIATTGASVEGARVKSWLEAILTLAAKDFPLGPALNTQVSSTRGKSKAAITANAREKCKRTQTVFGRKAAWSMACKA